MLNLRPYQKTLKNNVLAAWQRCRSVLAVLATGGGKTVIFSSVMHDHQGAATAIVHRKEIVGQISQALARLEVRHRIIAPPQVVTRIRRRHLKEFGRSYVDPDALAGVISVQTLTSRASDKNDMLRKWLGQITLAVFDEGHHYVQQGFWARAVETMHRAKLLFVTATPERADGKGLGAHADGFADEMIEGPSVQWLIEQGHLCRFVYKAPSTDLNLSGIPVTATGELNTKELRARVVESHLVGDVVEHYRQFAAGKRAIVFATDVATAHEMSAAFTAAGVTSAALSGETDQAERDKALDAFEAGSTAVLVNVDLFDEGFDVPGIEAVILARPTESLAKYLQMVGRALRPAPDKPHAIVIDPVRNWERHGMPNWPRVWSLDTRDRGSRGSNGELIPQRICTSCTQPYERFYRACPYCAAPVPEPSGRAAPEQVDGDLTELDVDAMTALFKRMEDADLDDAAFRAELHAKHVPIVGHNRLARMHSENKRRRAVLRELVAWWCGAQPGRELGEIHRRFYHRFGVDIGTAFTLKAADTNALIERIKQRFCDDII